jgi:PKD repeat protein
LLNVGGNRVPIAEFSVDPPTGIAATSFRFNGTLSRDPDGQISKYHWEFGDGASAEGANVTHKFPRPGNFKVKLTVSDNDQASGLVEKELPVKDGKLPIARFSISPNQGDTDTKFTFDASASQDPDGRIVDYRWNIGDGSRKSGKIVSYKFKTTGRFAVELVAFDNDGLVSTDERMVEVKGSAPVANFTISPTVGNTDTIFSFNGSSSFDSGGSIHGYSWNFGDGGTASGSVVQHQYSAAGTYNVRLTVVDNDGKQDSKDQSFRVFNPDGGGGGDDDDDDGGGGGRCTTPSRQRTPYFFRVISADSSSKVIVGEFFEDVECSDVFYLCGDVRVGGIGGTKEFWMGTICEMSDLGNNRFEIHLVHGTSWPDVGETGTYVWPQLDCNPAVTCR